MEAGVTSTKAYQQCMSKGSSLTISECIKICQMEDATHRQVQTLRPEIQSQPDIQDCSSPVHKVNNFYHLWGRSSYRGRGSHRGIRHNTNTWGNNCNSSHTCGNCGNPQHKYRSECKAFKVECYLCHRLGHFAHMCRTYLMQEKKWCKTHRHKWGRKSTIWTLQTRLHHTILSQEGGRNKINC